MNPMEIIKRLESIETYATEGGFDIVELVGNATWKELIMMLVETNKLDPWNIDITKVVDSYIETINRMKLLDLFMPANVIFAASVLLRIKSDTMRFFEEPAEEFYEEGTTARAERPEVEALVPIARHQPPSKITLQQLMDALDEAIKIEVKRVERDKAIPEPIKLNIEIEDIDEKINGVLKLVRDNADSYGLASFKSISRYFPDGYSMLMDLFVPLLYLQNRGDIAMTQEEFFGEIILHVLERQGRKADKAG
jgi:segregation and condensation protein A